MKVHQLNWFKTYIYIQVLKKYALRTEVTHMWMACFMEIVWRLSKGSLKQQGGEEMC